MPSPDTSPYFTGYNNGPGLSSVGSYQIAGTPFVTGSTLADGHVLQVFLPAVARRLLVQNNSGVPNTSLIVAFDNPTTNPAVLALGNGISVNSPGDIGAPSAYALSGSTNFVDLGIKCNSFYLYSPNSGGATVQYSVIAELTGIAPSQMFELSGSGINDV